MDEFKSPLSIRILYWITNIILGLLGLTVVLVIVFNILLYTDFFGSDMQLHTNLPGKIDYIESGNLYLNRQNMEVNLVEASPRIHFVDTPVFISRKLGVAMLIVLAFISYMMWIFRTFMRNVTKGNVFTLKNILILKRLAYTLAGLWLFTILYMRLMYHFIVENLAFENIVFKNDISNYAGILLVSLFIWVLAHVFQNGLELRKENELTV